MFKHDQSVNLFYLACPAENCGKKVTQNDSGSFDCIKCNKSHPTCLVKYILNMVLSDASTATWVTAFDEAAICIIGKSAAEIKQLRDQVSRNQKKKISKFLETNFFSGK